MTMNDKAVASKDPEVQDAQFFAAIGYLSFLCFEWANSVVPPTRKFDLEAVLGQAEI